MKETLKFKISTHLKTILGKELVSDEFVAILELVKNSFDANAKLVTIKFIDETIEISDNGTGMNYEDIVNKWLFVAFSEKKTKLRDDNQNISYAGSKGIGRFASDRIGKTITLITRKEEINSTAFQISINWDDFEGNQNEEFISISPVVSSYDEPFNNPGTKIIISRLIEPWDRLKIIQLKKRLAK